MGNVSTEEEKPKLYTREEALQIYIGKNNIQQARQLLIRNSHLLLLQCLPEGFDNNIAHEIWTFVGKKSFVKRRLYTTFSKNVFLLSSKQQTTLVGRKKTLFGFYFCRYFFMKKFIFHRHI